MSYTEKIRLEQEQDRVLQQAKAEIQARVDQAVQETPTGSGIDQAQSAIAYARQALQAEADANKAIIEGWAEKARESWVPFANGSLIQNGKLSLVDDEITRPGLLSRTQPTPTKKGGLPACHSGTTPDECGNAATHNRASDWQCEQCAYLPRNWRRV